MLSSFSSSADGDMNSAFLGELTEDDVHYSTTNSSTSFYHARSGGPRAATATTREESEVVGGVAVVGQQSSSSPPWWEHYLRNQCHLSIEAQQILKTLLVANDDQEQQGQEQQHVDLFSSRMTRQLWHERKDDDAEEDQDNKEQDDADENHDSDNDDDDEEEDTYNNIVERRSSKINTKKRIRATTSSTRRIVAKETVDRMTMNDERILQLAKIDKLSLLGSILRDVHEAPQRKVVDGDSSITTSGGITAVSTRTIVESFCLVVKPGLVPAHLDAKEIVLAALHFLSSEWSSSSLSLSASNGETPQQLLLLPTLPLIRPVQLLADLEKRLYVKVGDWNLSDIMPSIHNLEQVFLSSACDWKWIAREKFCPVGQFVTPSDRDQLLLKGSTPSYLVTTKKAKKKVAPTMIRSKAKTATATVVTGPVSSEIASSPSSSSSSSAELPFLSEFALATDAPSTDSM